MQKTFLLGVGCQKGGTTWIHRYLVSHPGTAFDYGKEYHVLDTLYVPGAETFLIDARRQLAKLENAAIRHPRRHKFVQNRITFCESPDLYLDYFPRLAAQNPETLVVGDITPSYAALPEDAFRWVRRGMAERRLRTRVLFMMRDPVERVISQFGMRHRSRVRHGERVDTMALADFYVTPICEVRTRYEKTLRTLDAAFERGDVLELFYEDLFRKETVASLCAHLGLPDWAADFGRVVNASPDAGDVDIGLRQKFARHFADTYAFVADRFGASRVEAVWKNYCLLG